MPRPHALFALVIAAIAAPAIAQTAPDQDATRVENRLERELDRKADRAMAKRSEKAVEEVKKPFTLTFSTPLAYSSNIGNEATGAKSSSYVDPSLSLTGEWSLGAAVLTVAGGVDAQVFSSHSAYDNATAYANTNLSLPGSISPYADYTVAAIYDGIFDSHSVTLHMFTVGASSEIELGAKDVLVLDLNAMRREASIAEAEQWRYGLTAQWVHILDNGATFSLSARGR